MVNIKRIIKDADSAFSAGEYEAAIELYKRALALDSKQRRVKQNLQKAEELKKLIDKADDCYYIGQYKGAIQLYEQVLEIDTGNKHAQEQIRKTERNQSSVTVTENVPDKAVEYYRRARSFIAMKDISEARKLLIEAIEVADEAGVEFSSARSLLGNIQNALKAEDFKARAYIAIETKLWSKADSELASALELDPTDETIKTLSSHLRYLLKAKGLLEQLDAEIVSGRERSNMIDEVKTIIASTGETTTLSTLWQEVVRLFGDYSNKNAMYRDRNKIFRWVMLFALSTSAILLITFWFLYIQPRQRGIVVACDAIAPGLVAKLEYPYYIANGDHHNLEMTFINNGTSKIDSRLLQVQFNGTANIEFLDLVNTNQIELTNLLPGRQVQKEVSFYVDGSSSVMPGPWYVSFSVSSCQPKDFYIAMAAIPGLQNFMKALGTIIAGAILGLFNDWIKDLMKWIRSFLPKPQPDPKAVNPASNI